MNKYVLEREEPIKVLKVDNTAVREAQIAAWPSCGRERDPAAVDATLNALTEAARSGEGNLLELAIDGGPGAGHGGRDQPCAGEGLRPPPGRVHVVRGVYAARDRRPQGDHRGGCRLVEQFERTEGRRPRILVAKMGQDGHDRGQKVIATAFADLGFDVDVGPLFQTPREAARQAVENDVHIVGVSTLAAGHLTLVPALRRELDDLGREDILIVVGGVIPPQDYEVLFKSGAVAVFGPGTMITEAALRLLDILEGQGLEKPAGAA